MICSDIWHKYQEWYSESKIWDNFTSGIYAKYHVQIMLLFVYTTTRRFVIFTCRYFKLSWKTNALSQSNCRNFLCCSIRYFVFRWKFRRAKWRLNTRFRWQTVLFLRTQDLLKNYVLAVTHINCTAIIHWTKINTGRKNGFTSIANLEQTICKCHICLILLNFASWRRTKFAIILH